MASYKSLKIFIGIQTRIEWLCELTSCPRDMTANKSNKNDFLNILEK